MINIDTNILVRYITNDDLPQTQKVKKLFESQESLYVLKSVFLECYWVLKSNYKFNKLTILSIFTNLSYLENIYFEDETMVLYAIQMSMDGLDFADAIHLTSTQSSHRFATFDEKLIKKAKISHLPVTFYQI